MKPRHCFAWIALSVLLLNGCQPETDFASVNAAKVYFENETSTLSLPLLNVPQTKSTDLQEIAQSVYPVWEKAITSEIDGRTLVEVPLSGAIKVVGVITTIDAGNYSIHRAASKSYLVFDYRESTPDIYIETFLQKGKKCTMSLASDRSNIIGIQIKSLPDGTVVERIGFIEGGAYPLTDKQKKIDVTRIKDVGYLGVRLAYALQGTKSGCSHWEFILCPECNLPYWGDISDPDTHCPVCGHFINEDEIGYVYCHICGHPIYECTCPNSEVCPSCNQLVYYCDESCSSSPYCTCDGGPH